MPGSQAPEAPVTARSAPRPLVEGDFGERQEKPRSQALFAQLTPPTPLPEMHRERLSTQRRKNSSLTANVSPARRPDAPTMTGSRLQK